MSQKKGKQDYMSVGELAKKMGVTVRTLQYYDREGLLSPSSVSDGGRRLYSDMDIVKLHQILSLKSLGFSLLEIKSKLTNIKTTQEIEKVLSEQSELLRSQIQSLTEVLNDIERLMREVLQMQEVDFKKIADIIVNLQMKNDDYWLIKYFDESTLEYLRSRFDKDSGMNMLKTIQAIFDRAMKYYNDNISPDSEQGISLAKEFWEMLMQFTNGDMNIMAQLMKVNEIVSGNEKWKEKQAMLNAFMQPALNCYFNSLRSNPFEVKE